MGFEFRLLLKNLLEIILSILSDFSAAMAVKYGEEHSIIVGHLDRLADVRVFHRGSPALHCAGTPGHMFVLAGVWIFVPDGLIQKASHLYNYLSNLLCFYYNFYITN